MGRWEPDLEETEVWSCISLSSSWGLCPALMPLVFLTAPRNLSFHQSLVPTDDTNSSAPAPVPELFFMVSLNLTHNFVISLFVNKVLSSFVYTICILWELWGEANST